MNSQRLRMMLLGVLGLLTLLFLATGTLGLSMLSSKSKKMVELKLESKTAEAQLARLEQSKKEINQYSYFKDVAKTVIPSDKDQAQALLEISQLAKDSGMNLQSVSFPASNLGGRPTTSATPGTAQPSASSQNVISQALPVSGITGLYSVELVITPETGVQVPSERQVTYPKMLDFLDRIERNRRTAQITQVDIQPQGTVTGPNQLINFSLNLNIFIKP